MDITDSSGYCHVIAGSSVSEGFYLATRRTFRSCSWHSHPWQVVGVVFSKELVTLNNLQSLNLMMLETNRIITILHGCLKCLMCGTFFKWHHKKNKQREGKTKMSKEKQGIWKDEYFESIRSNCQRAFKIPEDKIRWGGIGTVQILYYLTDNPTRTLDFVQFTWSIVSDRKDPNTKKHLTPPTAFQTVPPILIPQLERAQSSNKEVFVDFSTDANGDIKSAELITIATLCVPPKPHSK
jgi:hypothetical protein